MSVSFDSQVEEFTDLSGNAARLIKDIPGLNGDSRKSAVAQASSFIQDAEACIKQMDIEVRSLPASERYTYTGSVKEYKDKLANLKTDLRKAQAQFDGAREELFAGRNDLSVTSVDQRTRLLDSTQRLEGTGNRIDESYRTALETEQIGASILSDLHHQRGQLEDSRNTLTGINDNISKSRKILQSMARRVVTNKIIMIVIILVLIGCIGLIIYFKWIK
eukprot:GFYU01001430.1.p1 GENE.GFYU01001430.1~~GFYU01001430.1.p1  ORF type:complete len:234 (+),score=50.37 GFYU01001430.1:48-704(+)